MKKSEIVKVIDWSQNLYKLKLKLGTTYYSISFFRMLVADTFKFVPQKRYLLLFLP